ncbi:MAG: Ni/Co efflux regulator RcnB [Gammaproteobacteria bacterium]
MFVDCGRVNKGIEHVPETVKDPKMKAVVRASTLTLATVLALGFAGTPATAAKLSEAGKDEKEYAKFHKRHGKEKAAKKPKEKSEKFRHGKHFRDQDEDVVRRYYRGNSHRGKDCPPGLAKKNNGCMAPGQMKKQWTTGEPLPHDVEHHALARDLVSRLLLPPKGQRYARILSDVLLVDANTDVVIDATVDILIP